MNVTITLKNRRYSAMKGGYVEEPQEVEAEVVCENPATLVLLPAGWKKTITVRKSRVKEKPPIP